jgi:hypothetical protein
MSDVNPGSPVHKGSIERLSETACYNTNSMRREHNYQWYNPVFFSRYPRRRQASPLRISRFNPPIILLEAFFADSLDRHVPYIG